MSAVHVVVPDGIDDPARPSGGNVYDRRICDSLAALGASVVEHAVPGAWPRVDAGSLAALADVLDQIPDDTVVLIDGLIASGPADVLVPEARRLQLVVLVHMPLGHRPADDGARTRERAVLCAAAAIVTTSAWARRRCSSCTRCPLPGSTSPSRESTAPRLHPGPRPAERSNASRQ